MTALPEAFRTCQVTGLSVDRHAERLFKFNAVTAVLYLAVGGILAILVLLTRWQAVQLVQSPEWFYRLLGAHGAAMLLFWILFFEVAGLIFGGSILLSTRLRAPWLWWLAYVMMLVGSLVATWTMLSGQATVMFTAYPPMQAHPMFYGSVLLFAVGALLAVILFIVNLTAARISGEVRTLPLFTFALLAAAILALFTLVSGAAALIPAWLWSMGLIPSVDPGIYRLLFWGFGHGAQQVNLAAMIGIWYALASLTTGARPLNEGLSRAAFVLYILFIQMGSIHHILVDPGIGLWARGINTSYFVYAAVMASMIHAFTVPASVEVAQHAKGFVRGLFDWLRHAPWGEPGFGALAMSLFLFGVMGGISGVIMGGIQVNMIAHNTLIVPAHFHMTVVAGTTLAFMGISYYIVPLMFQRELFLKPLVKWQPYVYGFGMAIFAIGMGMAGHAGLPRRLWDYSYDGAPLGSSPLAANLFADPTLATWLAVMGIGGLIAITGGAMFVLVAAGTVFLGRRSATPDLGKIDALALAPSERVPAHTGRSFEAPGTLVLVSTFFVLFVLLYAISWFELARRPWIVG